MIGVISDDLTGAAELGAVGLRYGLAAEILVAGEPDANAELVCMDTSSRSCPPEEASRRAAAAARLLKAAKASWIYKKVDSVLRGHVTVEIEAVMKELGLNLALLVPANPLLGRVIRDGRYYVRGKPIHETEFAGDPEYPRKSPVVKDLLEPAISFRVQMLRWPAAIPESGIIVGEASAPLDLQRWAAGHHAQMLSAGGAEYFASLLAAAGHKAASPRTQAVSTEADEVQLFICGSASETSCTFTREAQAKGTSLFSLPASLAKGGSVPSQEVDSLVAQISSALSSRRRAILNVGLPVVPDKAIAGRLLNELGSVAEKILRSQKDIQHVFAEGGSTAAELVRRMGWKRLKVLREEARGVVTLGPEGSGNLLLTMKPGSYVWPAKWAANMSKS
jgi:uncharacterized protein YgbK (DUF1537 family)